MSKKNVTFRMYEHEINEVDKHCSKHKISRSDFFRNAIKEKMSGTNSPINLNVDLSEISAKLDAILNQQQDLAMVKLSLERLQAKFPSKIHEIDNIDDKKEIIRNIILKYRKTEAYFKYNRGLKTESISKEGINIDELFDILTNSEEFIRIKGGWDLNE